MKLLYVQPVYIGGLVDYAHEQANAMGNLGIEVRILAPRNFNQTRQGAYRVSPLFPRFGGDGESGLAIIQKLRTVVRALCSSSIVARVAARENYKHVLFGSYSEYLAPLWAWRFRRLAREGVVFGSVVHDPVRDFVVGPLWWHRRSVAEGYSFLREAFVHEDTALDTVRPMPRLRTTVIPHGPYHFPEATESPERVRQKLKLPEKARVMLSFGHIRDGKNLDLIIRAMNDLPSTYLIVAGKEQSFAQKSIEYYQGLARSLKVDGRCRWVHEHVPEKEVGNLFTASDLVLLTYSRSFRSASGVLNAAVTYRKPCVASSGGGNLQSVVERYNLGRFVEPDNLQALTSGIREAVQSSISPRWEVYENENSWQRNAQIVTERIFS